MLPAGPAGPGLCAAQEEGRHPGGHQGAGGADQAHRAARWHPRMVGPRLSAGQELQLGPDGGWVLAGHCVLRLPPGARAHRRPHSKHHARHAGDGAALPGAEGGRPSSWQLPAPTHAVPLALAGVRLPARLVRRVRSDACYVALHPNSTRHNPHPHPHHITDHTTHHRGPITHARAHNPCACPHAAPYKS